MDGRRPPCSERRKRPTILRTAIRMMDDVVGLSGHDRHVKSVEHDAGLQVGREGPSDDPARPGVENDRKVEKAGQRRQEGDVGHPQLVRPLGREVAADEIAGRMMVCRLSRRDRRASAPADACDPCRSHQPGNPLPASREAIGLQLGVNTRRAIGSMRSSVDRADMTRQTGVGGRPSRSWSSKVTAAGFGRSSSRHCNGFTHTTPPRVTRMPAAIMRTRRSVRPFGLARGRRRRGRIRNEDGRSWRLDAPVRSKRRLAAPDAPMPAHRCSPRQA